MVCKYQFSLAFVWAHRTLRNDPVFSPAHHLIQNEAEQPQITQGGHNRHLWLLLYFFSFYSLSLFFFFFFSFYSLSLFLSFFSFLSLDFLSRPFFEVWLLTGHDPAHVKTATWLRAASYFWSFSTVVQASFCSLIKAMFFGSNNQRSLQPFMWWEPVLCRRWNANSDVTLSISGVFATFFFFFSPKEQEAEPTEIFREPIISGFRSRFEISFA